MVTGAAPFHCGAGAPPRGARLSVSAPRDRATLERGLRLVAETLGGFPAAGPAIV